jgi:hypothetical protein
MMRLQLTLAAAGLAALIIASPARACGNGECDPPPPPPPPPVAIVPDDDSDPYVAAPVIHYAWCCADDGQPTWRVALLRDPVQAALQCHDRAQRYQEGGKSLPACPKRRVAE